MQAADSPLYSLLRRDWAGGAALALVVVAANLAACDDGQPIHLPDAGTTTTPTPSSGNPDLLIIDETTLSAFPNASGEARTLSTLGSFDHNNAFFKPTGKNNKTCEHCHFESDGFGLIRDHAIQLFAENPLHPLFQPDSSNDPVVAAQLNAQSTVTERHDAYTMMLTHAVAVVKLPWPPGKDPNTGMVPTPEFRVAGVQDPSLPKTLATAMIPAGPAGAMIAVTDPAAYFTYTHNTFFLHRRPIPTANFSFLSGVGWDNRFTLDPNPSVNPLRAAISQVARETIPKRMSSPDANSKNGYDANGVPYTDAQLFALGEQMTDFMMSAFSAESYSVPNDPALLMMPGFAGAGSLWLNGGKGGVVTLFHQDHYFGMNDLLEGDFKTFKPFDPNVMQMYTAWEGSTDPNKAMIAKGEKLFNSIRLTISGVNGLNDAPIQLPKDGPSGGKVIPGPPVIMGACSSCHNQPTAGNHTTRLTVDIGISDEFPAGLVPAAPRPSEFDGEPDPITSLFPVFTFHKVDAKGMDLPWTDPANTRRMTDPGRAATTGKWSELGAFKVPIIRSVEARSPYFHNGLPLNLEVLIDFYSARFGPPDPMNAGKRLEAFTPDEKAAIVEFVKTL